MERDARGAGGSFDVPYLSPEALKQLEGINITALDDAVMLRTSQAAGLLGMGHKKMRRQVAAGLLEAPSKIGCCQYWRLGSIRRFLELTKDFGPIR